MLKQIVLENFFSFRKQETIDLYTTPNILLGINGSGKSSFINSIKLLYEGIAGNGFADCFQTMWGGYHAVANVCGKEADAIRLTYIFDAAALKQLHQNSPFAADVTYSVTIRPVGISGYYLQEEFSSPDKEKNDPVVYLTFNNGSGRLSTLTDNKKVEFKEYDAQEISGQELVLRQINDPSRYLPMFVLRKAIEGLAIYSGFYTGTGSKLRQPSGSSEAIRLVASGENLTSLLNNLKNNNIPVFDKIQAALAKVNPSYQSIEFNFFGAQLYLSLKEKSLQRTITALHISDGTLKFLLYMAVLYNSEHTNLICIDEPENGLHPDMIKTVADAIKYASSHCQVIAATHSPLLLNCFEPDDILVFEKDEETNCTHVKRISEDDFEDWDGAFLPGQMWLQGQIGGKRW
jgi:predicted ATPase